MQGMGHSRGAGHLQIEGQRSCLAIRALLYVAKRTALYTDTDPAHFRVAVEALKDANDDGVRRIAQAVLVDEIAEVGEVTEFDHLLESLVVLLPSLFFQVHSDPHTQHKPWRAAGSGTSRGKAALQHIYIYAIHTHTCT